MEALIKQNTDNMIVLDLKGTIDYASAELLNKNCSNDYVKKKNIIFNMKDLHFVGSDGLALFLEALKQLKKNSQISLCCVSSEFSRLLSNTEETKELSIFEDEQEATKYLNNT